MDKDSNTAHDSAENSAHLSSIINTVMCDPDIVDSSAPINNSISDFGKGELHLTIDTGNEMDIDQLGEAKIEISDAQVHHLEAECNNESQPSESLDTNITERCPEVSNESESLNSPTVQDVDTPNEIAAPSEPR